MPFSDNNDNNMYFKTSVLCGMYANDNNLLIIKHFGINNVAKIWVILLPVCSKFHISFCGITTGASTKSLFLVKGEDRTTSN